MYEMFFGLERRPFPAVPDTDHFFSTSSLTETRQTIERVVRRGEGIAIILGESGTGKTLFLRLLRKRLDVEYTVSLLFNGRLETPKAFLQQVLFDLRLPFASADETELRLALWDFARQESTPGFVLLIDDAQHLNSSVLEEIRLLMNCDDGSVPFFRVVLAATPDLDEKLTNPIHDAFNQRVVSRSYLDMLTREETVDYVSWQTSISRLQRNEPEQLGEFRRLDGPHGTRLESIFTDGAKRLLYQLTDGLPRLINQLCDAALVLAAERVLHSVNESLIQTAWAQLQQIPDTLLACPSNISESTSDAPTESLDELIARKKVTLVLKEFESSIEFGTLEDAEPVLNSLPDDKESDDEETFVQLAEPIYVIAQPVVFEPPQPENKVEMDTGFANAIDLDTQASGAGPVDVQEIFQPDLNEVLDEMVAGKIGPENAAEICVSDAPDIVETPLFYTCRPRLPYPVRKRRVEPEIPRKYARPRLSCSRLHAVSLSLTCRTFEAGDSWIGCFTTRILFVPVHLSMPPVVTKTPAEETTPMNPETLEQYGREVLEGRPPFVRKEPHYAYQTSTELPVDFQPYPHPFYDLPLCWPTPKSRSEFGYGIAYSDFLQRELVASDNDCGGSMPVAEPLTVPVVRLALHPCRPMVVSSVTSFDEPFEEREIVEKYFTSTKEFRRPEEMHRNTSLPRGYPYDDELTRKIEAVVLRITQAAEKIEQAADVSESAGHIVRRAAEHVETEVCAVLPSYRELFRQLSDFSEEITALFLQTETPASAQKESLVLAFPVAGSKQLKPSRLGLPQSPIELPNAETERRIDVKQLFQ